MKIIWCSPTGSDITGTGSQTEPFASIDRALLDFVDGDQIRLLDGLFIPTDSIIISGMSGSIFSENPKASYIQPEKTSQHQACLAILDSPRFAIIGVNVLQAANHSGNLIGIYASNIDKFLCHTCAVNDFEVPSGICHGIFASGDGRIENCTVDNLACAGDALYGIRTLGIDIIDCEVTNLSGYGDCYIKGIDGDGLNP